MPIVTIQTTAKNGEIVTTTYVLDSAAEAEHVHSLLREMGKDGHAAHFVPGVTTPGSSLGLAEKGGGSGGLWPAFFHM